MLSSLNNQNVAAPLLQSLANEPGAAKPAQNANVFKDATNFSVELREQPHPAEGHADMSGLLAGLQDLAPQPKPPRAQPPQPQGGKVETPGKGRLLQMAYSQNKLHPDDPLAHKQQLNQMDQKELTRMYGEQSPLMEELAAARPDMSIEDAHKMFEIIDSEPAQGKEIVKFMGRRKDLSVSDAFMTRPDGKLEISPAMRDKRSRDALEIRQDLKPNELGKMGNGFQAALGDPMMAAEAYKSAVPTLAKRGDLRPENMNSMLNGMVRTLGEPRPALRAFQNGTRLLSSRPDINPKQINGLLDSVANVSRKDGELNVARVGGAFEQATNLLIDQPGRSIEDVTGLADMLSNRRITPQQKSTADNSGASQLAARAPMVPARPKPQQTLTLSGAQAPGGKKDRLGLFTEGLDLMRAQPDMTAGGAFTAVIPHYKPEPKKQPVGAFPA